MTACSASDILGIQPNLVILFYHKIRQVIDYHLSLEVDEIVEGKIELDESYNGINRKNFPLFLKESEFRFNAGAPKV